MGDQASYGRLSVRAAMAVVVRLVCWDRAELSLIRELEPQGYRDAFRVLHGPARRELSWVWPRWGGGYRLDHLIVSAEISVTSCEYEHDWREHGLSDHAALIADLTVAV